MLSDRLEGYIPEASRRAGRGQRGGELAGDAIDQMRRYRDAAAHQTIAGQYAQAAEYARRAAFHGLAAHRALIGPSIIEPSGDSGGSQGPEHRASGSVATRDGSSAAVGGAADARRFIDAVRSDPRTRSAYQGALSAAMSSGSTAPVAALLDQMGYRTTVADVADALQQSDGAGSPSSGPPSAPPSAPAYEPPTSMVPLASSAAPPSPPSAASPPRSPSAPSNDNSVTSDAETVTNDVLGVAQKVSPLASLIALPFMI